MRKYRDRLEALFASQAGWLYRHPWTSLLLSLLLLVLLASGVRKLTIDTSTEGFLHPQDPVLLEYNEFRDHFGRDEVVVIAVRPPQVFERGFLNRLQAMHRALEAEVPYLDEVNSLVNARNTYGRDDVLVVEDLLEDFPDTEAKVAELKRRVMDNPLLTNLVISERGDFTTLMVRTVASVGDTHADALAGFDDGLGDTASGDGDAAPAKVEYLTDAQNSEVVAAVQAVVARFQADDFQISVAGTPVITETLKRAMMNDMRQFMAMAIATIALFLLILFRRASGVFVPLLVVVVSLVSTVGLMGHAGVAIKVPTQILPSFLLSVAVGAVVHILALFFYRYDQGEAREKAVIDTYGHSGLAILMTSLTTAAGLASFATAEIDPIADLGIFAAIGVLLALCYTLYLVPALIALLPIRAKQQQRHVHRANRMDRLLTQTADFATGRPRSIVAVSLVVILVALVAATQLRFSHNPLLWLPQSMQVRGATELIDANLRGATTLEIIADTGVANGLYRPEILQRLEQESRRLEASEGVAGVPVGKVWSLADVVKETNRALNNNQSEHYRVPDERALVAQELLLFENSGSDDLENFTDSQFRTARITLKTPWVDANRYANLVQGVEQGFSELLDGMAEVRVTGMSALLGRTVDAAMVSAKHSYLIAAVVISLMMVFLVGSLREGLLSMIPNLLPILVVIGGMALFGEPMDMFTMMIGSIALGLAVDDTVHFMHNYRRYLDHTGDPREAVRRTLLSTGRAMMVTTIVLSIGFFIFMFASLNNLFLFGLLTGGAICLALAADFLVAPAIMTLLAQRDARRSVQQGVNV